MSRLIILVSYENKELSGCIYIMGNPENEESPGYTCII